MLADHMCQAIENDAQQLWSQLKTKWADPVTINAPAHEARIIQQTVYGQKWGTCVVDEAHKMRTFNRTFMACMKLGPLCDVRIALSATPGITSPLVSHICIEFEVCGSDQ